MSDMSSPERETEPSAKADPRAEPTCDYAADAVAAELAKILDQYLADLKAGCAPSRDELIAQHSQLAGQLEACLAGLEFIHVAETAAPNVQQRLGDFRIIREVGRGGMGAVFEAEQISLGRRVALKILRFGGFSDPEAIERFQREAATVATLHHTNIVPIFNLGSERGVNYYAMQFIEGRSLAEVLAEQQGPLPAEQVAVWGLQAAEALAHAHQRGVVHRDVKPSNLLIDRENRLWLTDFGLARRLDDVTLSMTGALLGTPRYMSPEQAAAARKRVDHRSDLFSLGATLYELLSGQPAFSGDTPHEVIQSILAAEPSPLRQLAAAVPRDLETIVMKCLAKEPSERYAAARELADDLRAFLDGRAIRARRASPLETARRWARRHRRSLALASAAAAATLLVTMAGFFAWSGYRTWRQGSIRLDAVNPPLVAEIIDARGDTVRTDTLPMQAAASLPAGEYEVRVSAEGTLSQTFGLQLDRGQNLTYSVNLNDQLLLAPQEIDGAYAIVDFGEERRIVLWTKEGIGLRQARIPQVIWNVKLGPEHATAMQKAKGFRWPWNSASTWRSGYGSYATQPWVSPLAVDVDGDGVGDLLCAGRHQAWLMAVSGADGSVLWFAPRSEQLFEPQPEGGQYRQAEIRSAVLGEPAISCDCNNDGISDPIAVCADIGANPSIQQSRYACRRWVEAVSGKTGETIWRYDLADALFDLPAAAPAVGPSSVEIPYDLRWFAGFDGGMTSGGHGSMLAGRHIARDRAFQQRTGAHVYRPSSPRLVSFAGRRCVALVAGKHVVLLDPTSGEAVEAPIDIGARPGKEPQWADVDSDGSAEVVLLEEKPVGGFPSFPTAKVAVWSYARRRVLWLRQLDAYWPQRPGWTVEAPVWPLVVDLNADGKLEVVVPDGRSRGAGTLGGRLGFNDTPWGKLAVMSAETGEDIWARKLVSIDSQIDSFLDGPDLNGDGSRELFAVTLAGNDYSVYVDALSGATGETLWTSRATPPNDRGLSAGFVLAPPQWRRASIDGWPQLLVPLVEELSGQRRGMFPFVFSAGTGRLAHRGSGMTAVHPADLDGDGLDDLVVFESKSAEQLDFGGELKCLRGIAAQPWKRLGELGAPAADFDGDGIRDLVRSWGDGTLLAASGASGRELWRSTAIRSTSELRVQAAGSADSAGNRTASGDLDGDGAVDLLVGERSGGGRGRITPLHAVSGRTGRRLWTVPEVTAKMIGGMLAAASRDLDADGNAEVLWLVALDYGYPERFGFTSGEAQLWLFVTSGQTGRLKWSQPLSPQYGLVPGTPAAFQLADVELALECGDLNRDGTLDVMVPAATAEDRLELRALSGKDGALLWKRSRELDGLAQLSLQNWTSPTICDLDGDRSAEVIVVEPAVSETGQSGVGQPVRVVALAGETGREQWRRVTDATYTNFRSLSEKRGELLRPVVLRAASGRQRAGVYLPGANDKVIVFDAGGESHERTLRHHPWAAGLRVCDADGDGLDELVFADESSLYVAPSDRLEAPRWNRPLNSAGQRPVLSILPSDGEQPALIVFATDPTANNLLGVDAATGRTVWSCPGPAPRDMASGTFMAPNQIALLGARQGQTPLVYYAFGFMTECRQAVSPPTADLAPGSDSPSSALSLSPSLPLTSLADRGVAVAPPSLGGLRTDARWQRDLPWRTDRNIDFQQAATFIGWGMLFAFALAIVPCGYVVRLVLLRRFNLRALLGLPVAASIFLTAALAPAPTSYEFRSFTARLITGFAFAPPLLALFLLARWYATGRWKRATLWLALVPLASVLLGCISLYLSLSQAPLEPEETLDWTGWHHIVVFGAYAASWLLVLAVLAELLINAALNFFRRRAHRPSAPS